jgi:endo-1,4-beta-xylanase
VKYLQDAGIRIDGVGLQSHFIVGETPSIDTQISNMKAFTDMNVEVAITEYVIPSIHFLFRIFLVFLK